jgi:hypothetical protein
MQTLKTGTELKLCLKHGTMNNIFFEKLKPGLHRNRHSTRVLLSLRSTLLCQSINFQQIANSFKKDFLVLLFIFIKPEINLMNNGTT